VRLFCLNLPQKRTFLSQILGSREAESTPAKRGFL
jgi:hypothetical protein